MMGLKDLVKLKPKETVIQIKDEQPNEEARKRTYHEAGYRDSSRNTGNSQTLSICLDAIYAKFENEEKELQHKQEELKKPYAQEQLEKESEIKGFQVAIDNANEKIAHNEDKNQDVEKLIKELKFEITDLPQNPDAYGIPAKQGASTKFWIGIGALIPITIYLFMFYTSVVYSAMIREFTYGSTKIFAPKSIVRAWESGFQDFATVIFAPFIFIGLGYLIHMFYQKKNIASYFKLAAIIVVTLIFDILLAFFIERKLWELNAVSLKDKFGFAEAIKSQEFWLIIFLGFIVYLIWGFIFDFVMEEHKEKDKIKNAIRKRNEQITLHKEQIHDNKTKIDEVRVLIQEIKEKISKAKGRINELQRIIDGTIIPTKEYKLYASEYLQGWLTFINEKLVISKFENDKLISECLEISKAHLAKIGVREDYHNTIFTKTH
ncbi:beta-carotene 15,15'-monooxygenase [Aquimarina sp. ERC-38]|uniref:beta-carotene 15,15'-monooxygenase n=1 Tax=Aquimarina sp. ERC-38 TaxID=2949996 RepID=UPI0022454A14|nr:beta-carotene 15,15'-monooxygenase [Aquimarina sp. ERC-38]UZO81534.1 beta-carotene 15,15'-monooxygenase [Aquimarina sp. ERC-38]